MDIDFVARKVIEVFYRLDRLPTSPDSEDRTGSNADDTTTNIVISDDRGPRSWEWLGMAGGFSGAQFWRIHHGELQWCLRRWPRQTLEDERKIRWIHRQLSIVAKITSEQSGRPLVPLPVPNVENETLTDQAGHFWQLEPWMPGTADFWNHPSPERLRSAMQTLGLIHRTLHTRPCRQENSRALVTRSNTLAKFFDRDLSATFKKIEMAGRATNASFGDISRMVCDNFRRFFANRSRAADFSQNLNRLANQPVEMQSVVGDIWHDHVLFQGEAVSGIVDFGAMRMDNRAVDVARLLGSLVGDNPEQRAYGLASYEEVFPLQTSERALIPVLDQTSTLLSGLNWLEWLNVEKRVFDDMAAIRKRLERILKRLEFLLAKL